MAKIDLANILNQREREEAQKAKETAQTTTHNEIQKTFSYADMPETVANSLRHHEMVIRGIQSKAIFETGEELQAAHDELANYQDGKFVEWYEALGFHPQQVKRILDYYNFVFTNCENRNFLETLPKSLIYEAANKSAPQELKQGVINGDITTLKQYKELKAQLDAANKAKEEAERRASEAESHRESAERGNEQAWKEAKEARERSAEVERERDRLQKEWDDEKAYTEKLRVERLHMQDEQDKLKAALADAQNTPPTVVETAGVAQEEYDRLKAELDELRRNPPVKRVEVKPADYENLKRENAMLHAHEEGQSLHQKALIDEQYSAYRMSDEEEYRASTQMDNLLSALLNMPKGAEIQENVRCWIKEQGDDEYAVAELEKSLIDLQDIHDALQNALNNRRKLWVVK